MGVSHRRIKEWQEFRVDTPSSKLLSPPRCKQQGTHQPSWVWLVGGAPDRGKYQSQKEGPSRTFFPPSSFRQSCNRLWLVPLLSDQESWNVWSLPVGTDANYWQKQRLWVAGGCGANTRVWGCTHGDRACTQASDTAKSLTVQGLKEALSLLTHAVTESPSWKGLKGHLMLEHLLWQEIYYLLRQTAPSWSVLTVGRLFLTLGPDWALLFIRHPF